jgi:antitoxin VapB
LAQLTGESITDAVRIAIEQRLHRESVRQRAGVAEQLLAIGAAWSRRPRLTTEDPDTVLGYDTHGLPS